MHLKSTPVKATEKTVRHAHIKRNLPELHRAVLDVVGVFNSPVRDEAMLESAGLSLERALFPLLVLVGKYEPIGVIDVSERVGRDYTTVSRQLSRLEELGLVNRRMSSKDRRAREVTITSSGKRAIQAVDGARERLAVKMFKGWNEIDFDQLLRLLRMLADGLEQTPAPGSALARKMEGRESH
jgi:DNA-binding MarR family transcriptional regulator